MRFKCLIPFALFPFFPLLSVSCGGEEVVVEPSIDVSPSTLTRSSITRVVVTGEATGFDSETTFDFGEGITILDSVVVNEEGAWLEVYIDYSAILGNREVTVTYGSDILKAFIKVQKETPSITETWGGVVLLHHAADLFSGEGCNAIGLFSLDFGGFEDPILSITEIPEPGEYYTHDGGGWELSSTIDAGSYLLLSSSSTDIFMPKSPEYPDQYYYSVQVDCNDILAGQTFTLSNTDNPNFLTFMKGVLRIELPLTVISPDVTSEILVVPGEELELEWEEGFGNEVILVVFTTYDESAIYGDVVMALEDTGSATIPSEVTSLLSPDLSLLIRIMRLERLESEIAEGELFIEGVSEQWVFGYTGRGSSISPSQGVKGETLDVSVYCALCGFVEGSVEADFGEGITINSTTFEDGQNVRFNISILSTATSGRRTVTVDYGTGTLEFTETFAVLDGYLPLIDDCAGVFPSANLSSGFYSGDTSSALDDFDPLSTGCTGFAEEGNDLVYKTYVEDGETIDLYLEYTEGVDASLYILSSCVDETSCVAGADDNNGTWEELSYTHSGTPLTYYIVIDSFSGAGEFLFDFDIY